MVEHCVYIAGVGGSIPSATTRFMKPIYAILILFVFTILVITYRENNTSSTLTNYSKRDATIGSKIYTLYVANTEELRSKGLSKTPSIRDNEGMIFIFEKPGQYSFWMKEMHFSLDFIYLNNNLVVEILENIAPETYPTTFTPKKPTDTVIELNGGEAKKAGIKVNDEVSF